MKNLVEGNVRQIINSSKNTIDVYSLLDQLKKYEECLDEESKADFVSLLLKFLENEEKGFWGISIYFFIEFKYSKVLNDVYRIYKERKLSSKCKEEVLFLLASLGFKKDKDIFIHFVRSNFVKKESRIKILSALCHVDKTLYISTMTRCLSKRIIKDKFIENYIPGIIYNLIECDLDLLMKIFLQVHKKNRHAFKKLMGNTISLIEKPWFKDSICENSFNKIVDTIEAIQLRTAPETPSYCAKLNPESWD